MTEQERELMIHIRQQQVVGPGMVMGSSEFKGWACKTYDISEARLTQLMREVLDGH